MPALGSQAAWKSLRSDWQRAVLARNHGGQKGDNRGAFRRGDPFTMDKRYFGVAPYSRMSQ
jgi:hypothetical protein